MQNNLIKNDCTILLLDLNGFEYRINFIYFFSSVFLFLSMISYHPITEKYEQKKTYSIAIFSRSPRARILYYKYDEWKYIVKTIFSSKRLKNTWQIEVK